MTNELDFTKADEFCPLFDVAYPDEQSNHYVLSGTHRGTEYYELIPRGDMRDKLRGFVWQSFCPYTKAIATFYEIRTWNEMEKEWWCGHGATRVGSVNYARMDFEGTIQDWNEKDDV